MQFDAIVNMAEKGVLVTISGAALSLLLYENVRSNGDQMGLLLGNVLTFITKNVTDCDRQEEHVKHHINIDTVVTCSKDILQDGLGRIDKEKLETFIRNKEKCVVGWFRFRRHNFLSPTMRDKIMHKEFSSHFVQFTGASEEHFIMFLLNASTTGHSNSTHKYRHVCFQYKQGTFQSVPLRINNLGDDAARHDGSDYKTVPEKKPEEPDVFTKLVEDLKLNPSTTSSVDVVTAIQKRAEQYLFGMMAIVSQSDEEISKLQQQVNELRAKVQKSTWAKSSRQKEKTAELQYSTENERVFTTAQIHGSPRSTHSDDLFDSDPSAHALPSNSPHSNSFMATKNVNIERTKFLKETRNHSSPDSNFCELLRSESSPETSRSKESTAKLMYKGNFEEMIPTSKRQSNSPKNSGKKSERNSFGDFAGHSQEETSTLGRKEQSPRPSSYTEQR